MRFITAVGAWFACASMAMLDCVMIWLRWNCIISSIVVGSGRSSSSASPEPLIASPRRLSVYSTVSPSRVVKLSVLPPSVIVICSPASIADWLSGLTPIMLGAG